MISQIADIAGIAAAIFSLLAWLKSMQIQKELEEERLRMKQEVQIILRHGGQSIPLPGIVMTRAELTRAEILGRLGMIPTKERGKRFVLAHLATPEFIKQTQEIMNGTKQGTLIIPCTQQETEQFDLNGIGDIER